MKVGNVSYDTIAKKDGVMTKVFHMNDQKKRSDNPHERFFTRTLFMNEIQKNPELAEAFAMFVTQYFPSYRWLNFNPNDLFETVCLEASYHEFDFMDHYENDPNVDLTNAMKFGDIATEFLIRYRNYNLIGCMGQKIILTAQNGCDKKFPEEISQGYSLQRLAKIDYKRFPQELQDLMPGLKGFFKKLSVLPTRDVGYPIKETIEVVNESSIEQMLNPKYEKII